MWMKKKSKRLNLKGWAEMENLQKELSTAAKEGSAETVANCIFDIIGLADNKNYENKFWLDTITALTEVQQANAPTKRFPILSTHAKKSDPLPWEYSGRSWYFWLNLFSSNYGWTEGQVGVLDIDTAIGLYQEILIDEQIRQEWEWGLSEVSYSYDKATKKSKFNKLPRPAWMNGVAQKPKQPETIKIHKSLMPQGNIVDIG